jgi:hypothetical protein
MTTSIEDKLARMTILALRAVQLETRKPHHYCLMPTDKSLSENEIVQLLAELPKPLACTAERRGVALVLTCRSIDVNEPASLYQHQMEAIRTGTGTFGTILRALRRGNRRKVRLSGSGEAIVCSASELRAWEEQYVIASSYSVAVYEDPEPERAPDLAFDVQIGASRATSVSSRATSVSKE